MGALARGSVALYSMLLRLRYPADLRDRFGADMVEAFRLWVEGAAEEAGLRGVARVWLAAARDLTRRQPAPVGGSDTSPVPPKRHGAGAAGLAEDLTFAAKSLRRSMGFSALLVAVIGLGIGLNTTVFAVVNAYLLRPLPYPEAERLVAVNGPSVLSWTEVDDVLDLAVSWDLDAFTLVGDPKPENVPGAWITPDFLEAYAVSAQIGRVFTPDEAGPGGSAVAMISHRLWQERFSGDPGVIGITFRAYTSDRPDEGEVFTVVGVLPEDFWYVNPYTEVLVPIREERGLYAGRLREGVSMAAAEAALNQRAEEQLREIGPQARIRIGSLQDRYVFFLRPTLVMLQVAVLLVLLIACANGSVLLLMRAIGREREMGMRRALGAAPIRLARQLLFEGLLVAGLAALIGTALSIWSVAAIGSVIQERLGRSAPGGFETLAVDGTVLGATVGVAALVGVLFGLVPLLVTVGGPLGRLLGSGARAGDSRGRRRARHALVCAELTLTLALLMGAGLLVRSSMHLSTIDMGFDASDVVQGGIGLRAGSYPTPEASHRLFEAFVQDVEALPSVTAVGLTGTTTFLSGNPGRPIATEDGGATASATETTVTGGYFGALRIPLLSGRTFTADDAYSAEPVAIVSASLAERLWQGRDPVGERLVWLPEDAQAEPEPPRTVVGVVGDVYRGSQGTPLEQVYRPLQQDERLWMYVVARARGERSAVVVDLEQVLRAHAPETPLSGASWLADMVELDAAPTRFFASMMGGFSVFASLLAVLGMYGVMAYAAQQQQREVAIRMALGADSEQVTHRFLRTGGVIVGIGLLLGSFGGVQLGRGLETQLRGIPVWDPPSHVLLAFTLLITAMLAVWIPARRAARQLPMQVLREE